MGPILVAFLTWFLMTLWERCLVGDECLTWPLILSVIKVSLVMGLVCGLVAAIIAEVAVWLLGRPM